MKHGVIKLTLATMIAAGFTGWWLAGFPHGYIPGRYDAANQRYYTFWSPKGFACCNGYFRIKFYTPFPRHALVSTDGWIAIPFRHDNLSDADTNGLVITLKRSDQGNINDQYGLLNTRNTLIANPEWHIIRILPDGLIYLKKRGAERHEVLMDRNGRPVFPAGSRLTLFQIKTDADPYILSGNDTVSYIYFTKSKRLIKKDLQLTGGSIHYTTGDKGIILLGRPAGSTGSRQYAIIDDEGRELLPFCYRLITGFSYQIDNYQQSMFHVRQDTLDGIYNAATERWVLPPGAYYIKSCCDMPLYRIQKENGPPYYIDRQGMVLLSPDITLLREERRFIDFKKHGISYHLVYHDSSGRFYWYKGLKG